MEKIEGFTTTLTQCTQCRHRQDVPGGIPTYSRCMHPVVLEELKSPLGRILTSLGANMGGSIYVGAMQKLGVVEDPHAMLTGDFLWPYVFDPIWIQSCQGFKSKD